MTTQKEVLTKERPINNSPTDIPIIYPVETKKPPRNQESWLAQVDFNGPRIILTKKNDSITIKRITEGGTEDISGIFGEIEDPFRNLMYDIVVDGQLIYDQGNTEVDRKAVETRIHQHLENPQGFNALRVSFIVNDILYEDGFDLRKRPYFERHARLEKLIEPSIRSKHNISPNYTEEDIPALIESARENGYQRVSFRRKDGLYMPGQRAWQIYKID